MPSIDREAEKAAVERVLASPGFARNERMSRFLRFIVERHLEGKDHELKESVLAVEVFGRRPDFDPTRDPVVRTEAGRLRARLQEYYSDQGKADALVIDLPKGGYVPRLRKAGSSQRPTLARPLWLCLAVALLLAFLGLWRLHQKNAPIPIAVLPLQNVSTDPASDYFADGLTDELIHNLSIIDGLAVRSRTSSFSMKGKPHNIRDVGAQLHADYILEGSVLRAGQHLRIDVQFPRS
jgi:hypothetical protein